MILPCPQDFHEDFVKYFAKSTIKMSAAFHLSTRRITPTKMLYEVLSGRIWLEL
jgi:hypothetical protein